MVLWCSSRVKWLHVVRYPPEWGGWGSSGQLLARLGEMWSHSQVRALKLHTGSACFQLSLTCPCQTPPLEVALAVKPWLKGKKKKRSNSVTETAPKQLPVILHVLKAEEVPWKLGILRQRKKKSRSGGLARVSVGCVSSPSTKTKQRIGAPCAAVGG